MGILEDLAPRLRYDSAERFFDVSVEAVLGEPAARPGEYAAVARERVAADPELADVVYGCLVEGWAQFWRFSPYNWSLLKGRHEGDWEMTQVLVDESGAPIAAAYAQHGGGEMRKWPLVEVEDGHHVVYVANGTHASHYTAGLHRRTAVSVERANGQGRHVTPRVLAMPVAGWPLRLAKWGGDDGSPASPGRHLQYRHPTAWADTLRRR